MAIRQLEEINSSGELISIRKGGAAAGDEVPITDYVDGADDLKADTTYVDAADALLQTKALLNSDVDTHLADGTVPAVEAGTLEALSALILQWTSDPAYEGMYLRIGTGGVVTPFRVPESDTTWSGTNANDVSLGETPQTVATIDTPTAIDQDVTAGDGTYQISGSLSNTSNQNRIVTVELFVNGISRGTEDIVVLKNELGKIFVLSNPIVSQIDSGWPVYMDMEADDDGDVTLLGTQTVTTLSITKAAATANLAQFEDLEAVVSTLDDTIHRAYKYTGNLTNTPTENKILSALGGDVIQPFGKFFLYDNPGRVFTVVFSGTDFYYERLNKAL